MALSILSCTSMWFIAFSGPPAGFSAPVLQLRNLTVAETGQSDWIANANIKCSALNPISSPHSTVLAAASCFAILAIILLCSLQLELPSSLPLWFGLLTSCSFARGKNYLFKSGSARYSRYWQMICY